MSIEIIVGLISALCCTGGLIYLVVDKKTRQKDSDSTIIHTMTESMTSMLAEMKDNRLEMSEQRNAMNHQSQEIGDLRNQVSDLNDKVSELSDNLSEFGCYNAKSCDVRKWRKTKK